MAYLGNDLSTIVKSGKVAYKFLATSGQTSFTGNDANGVALELTTDSFVNVFLNGVRLIKTDDYTLSYNTLTLVSGATLNDELIIVRDIDNSVYTSYTKTEADALLVTKANQSTTYTKTEVNAAIGAIDLSGYAPLSGATFSGNINLPTDVKLNLGATSDGTLYSGANYVQLKSNGGQNGVMLSNSGDAIYIKTAYSDGSRFDSSGLTLTDAGSNERIKLARLTGVVTATSFSGNGSSLQSLNASNLASGTLSSDRLPTGTIKQIVSTTFKDSWQSTASGWLDVTGLSLSITTTTGKIYAVFSLHLDASSSNGVAGFRILRNGVAEGNGVGINGVTGAWNSFGTGSDAQQFSPTFLDTGLAAGTYTYKVQVNRNSCSSISVNRFSQNDTFIGTNIAQSSITLMEIV